MTFRREQLPDARGFYTGEGGKIGRAGASGWAPCYGDLCPAHRSQGKRSFSVNVNHGGWKCFGCGVSGSMVDYVMQKYGLAFRAGAELLGAWGDDTKLIPRPQVLERHLTIDYVIDGVEYRASVRDETDSYRRKMIRFHREASDRLVELGQGDKEKYDGERETCWARMALAHDELRETENL